jgi:hypothetical protein
LVNLPSKKINNKKKVGSKMANLYTIENLLQGKQYRSKSLNGEIINGEKTDHWFGNDKEAYRVLIRTPHSYKDYYRIIAVKVGE